MVLTSAMNYLVRIAIFTLVIMFILVGESIAIDYSKGSCSNFVRGSFEFGEAGEGCDVEAYTSLSKVLFTYQDFVFDRMNPTSGKREEYVTSIVGLISDLSRFYINQRKPDVSEEEEKAWVRAILAKGNQETYLSHYRVDRDGRVKLTTGDRLYSYGIMQIHRRWHKIQDTEIGVDIVENIMYALDHYYDFWKAARGVSCVRGRAGNKDYLLRIARSAYAAYNGGPGSYCRWTNSKSKWAQNDRGYLQKWNKQLWLGYAEKHQDESQSPVKISCLMDGDGVCNNSSKYDAYVAGTTVYLPDGKTCRLNGDSELACFSDSRALNCLIPDGEMPEGIKGYINNDEMGELKMTHYHDRDQLCRKNYQDLLPLFSFVKPNKSINLRATPGGRQLAGVSPKRVYQILDYDMKSDGSGGRYYKVYSNGHYGYFYAGDTESAATWAEPAEEDLSRSVVPLQDQSFEVVKKDGIKLLDEPKDTANALDVVEKGETLSVNKIKMVGVERQIYISVFFKGQSGWLYIGRIHPKVTVGDWVKVKQVEVK